MAKSKIQKAQFTLKNEGLPALAKKSLKFTAYKLKGPQKLHVSEAYDYLSNPIFAITQDDLDKSKKAASANLKNINTALWFVPYFDHLTFGGIFTIFRFMEGFAKKGVKTTAVIYDNHYIDVDKMKAEISQHFPALKDINLIVFDPKKHNINELPSSDISFATIWMSAYFLLRYNNTKRKYYFIQDYEPLFYEGGSMYALAESTYRFGFTGIVNTPGLLWAVNQRHGLEGVSFIPAVDKKYYYPHPDKKYNDRVRIFFYARPNNPRNAFELGVLIIQELIKKYGKKIEIITAGAAWNEKNYGLKGEITNLGLLDSLEKVGDLYRTCDVGFVYMLSKHPSYQPFEFMACGMATVSNRNEDNLWLFKHGQNCLLAEPSPAAMAEQIGRLIEDKKLRTKIALTGQKNINFDWESQIREIWRYIEKNV
jgi:glycosyltransferase involved in cell wall biosynthesis